MGVQSVALDSHRYLVEALNAMLQHDAKCEIAIESKPNEPMDHAYIPTIGHALAIAHQTIDPSRVGGLIETAHALLAGLDPSDEMAFALLAGKLWSVHLNDQNGLKFDQDKSFGSANLRQAFNQVRVLDEAGYGRSASVCVDGSGRWWVAWISWGRDGECVRVSSRLPGEGWSALAAANRSIGDTGANWSFNTISSIKTRRGDLQETGRAPRDFGLH
jgi:hypothetical protein